MCHYYGNALSVLNDTYEYPQAHSELLQSEHLQAIRMLPSFQRLVEDSVESQKFSHARRLLVDDSYLLEEIGKSLESGRATFTRLLRATHILTISSPDPVEKIALYITTFEGSLYQSDFVARVLDSIKRMAPDDLVASIEAIREAIGYGAPNMELEGWADEEPDFLDGLKDIQAQVMAIVKNSSEAVNPVRSSYAIHSKGLRTTVIAQRVQLSYEESTLSEQDKAFTSLVERLSAMLERYFTLDTLRELFLNEVWLYDSTIPYRDVFTPRPKAAIEQALSLPHHYLGCSCCESVESLSSTQPATAVLYQLYLEAGSLINIYDLWSAFVDLMGGSENEMTIDERDLLVLFYRALADLKLLGMVKQSRKKADHLAKISWKGL